MKIATLKNGRRDGQPAVVDGALERCVSVSEAVPSLQRALEDWDRFAPTLAEAARALEAGERDDAEPFEAARRRGSSNVPLFPFLGHRTGHLTLRHKVRG